MSEPTEVDKVYVAVLSVRGTTVSFFSVDPVAMDFMAVCKLLLGDVWLWLGAWLWEWSSPSSF